MARNCPLFALVVIALGLPTIASAEVVILYDGAGGEKPDDSTPQQLTFFGFDPNDPLNPPTDAYDGGTESTRLNTTGSQSLYGGWSNYFSDGTAVNPDLPELDRSAGYSIKFSMLLDNASNSAANRAGFSIIAISSDADAGVSSSIEIGIQGTKVYSLASDLEAFDDEADFTPGTSDFVDYELIVAQDSYSFLADGNELLSGSLQDYFEFNPPEGVPDPYEQANLIFFGDDTTSAGGDIYFQKAELSLKAVPEAGTVPVLAAAFLIGALCIVIRKRRAKSTVTSTGPAAN